MSIPLASTALGALILSAWPSTVHCGEPPSEARAANTAPALSSSCAASPQPSLWSGTSLACSIARGGKSSARRSAMKAASRAMAPSPEADTCATRGPRKASVCRRVLVRMQQELLHAPIQNFGDVECVLVRAGDGMHPTELLELFSRAAEHPQHLAIERQLVEAAGERIGDVEHLIGRRRDAQCPWRARRHGAALFQIVRQVGLVADRRLGVGIGRNVDAQRALIFAVAVEHLDAAVVAVGDVDHAARIGSDVVK